MAIGYNKWKPRATSEGFCTFDWGQKTRVLASKGRTYG